MAKKVTAKKATVKKPVMKSGGVKKPLKKYQGNKGGSSVKTPFQEYMTTPGAVASDTVMSRKPFTPTTFDRSTLEKPKAKNPQNTKALINAAEKTYGMDVWDRPWTTGTKNKYLTPAEEKEFRRMGPLKKKGGTVAKPKMKKGGAIKAKKNGKVSSMAKKGR